MGNSERILVRIAVVHFVMLVIVQAILIVSVTPTYMNRTIHYEGVLRNTGYDIQEVIAR